MRGILWTIMIALFSVVHLQAEEEVTKKVVYNLTTGDSKTLKRRLIKGIIAHKTYYQSKLQELDVRVVIHGDAYKFFMKDFNHTAYAYDAKLVKEQQELGKRLSSLAKQYDVVFEVCEAGVIAKKLPKKGFYPFVSMVHNAAIGLIDAQNAGYAYLEVR